MRMDMCGCVSHYICHRHSPIFSNQVPPNVLVIGDSKDGCPPERIRSLLQGLKKEAETSCFTIEGMVEFLSSRLVQFHPFVGVVIHRIGVGKSRRECKDEGRRGIDCLSHVGSESAKSRRLTKNVRSKSGDDVLSL